MRLLSYNIQLDGLDVPGHLWIDRRKAIIEMIQTCDVIGLQEVTFRQFTDILQLTPGYHWVGINTVTGKPLIDEAPSDQEGLVIGWKKEVARLSAVHPFMWFSQTPTVPSRYPGTLFNKGLLYITLDMMCGQCRQLHVLNSHFPHDDGVFTNPRFLAAQQEMVILCNLQERGLDWISCGDRNFVDPRDRHVSALYAEYDTRYTSLVRSGVNTTFLGYENHPKCNEIDWDFMRPMYMSGEPSFTYFQSDVHLDMVASNLEPRRWSSNPCEYDSNGRLLPLGPVRSNDRRFASDHCAIVVTF